MKEENRGDQFNSSMIRWLEILRFGVSSLSSSEKAGGVTLSLFANHSTISPLADGDPSVRL